MKAVWIVGMLALVVLGSGVAVWLSEPGDHGTAPPPRRETLQQVSQQTPFLAKGFTTKEGDRIKELHAGVVTALNDLDLANGIMKGTTDDGKEVVMKVSPKFGATRMDINVRHDDTMLWTPNKRKDGDPWMLIFGSKGKPLSAENLAEETGFQKNPMVLEIAAALRKQVAAANLGQDFGFETKKHLGWAKPLKLTKKECLSCHTGMKVGDTVAISAFTKLKKAR